MTRTGGQHGTGEIGKKMSPVAGFILEFINAPTVYLAGDTIWCPEVVQVLDQYQPAITILYGGGARFLTGDPITMTDVDILAVCRHHPATRVVVLHMEAFNHCLLSRADLQTSLQKHQLADRVWVPADGAVIDL